MNEGGMAIIAKLWPVNKTSVMSEDSQLKSTDVGITYVHT